jgi:hypothetical protein
MFCYHIRPSTLKGLLNKKAELTKGSSFGSSAIFYYYLRPAAFRPLLTKGLALSGKLLSKNYFWDFILN